MTQYLPLLLALAPCLVLKIEGPSHVLDLSLVLPSMPKTLPGNSPSTPKELGHSLLLPVHLLGSGVLFLTHSSNRQRGVVVQVLSLGV